MNNVSALLACVSCLSTVIHPLPQNDTVSLRINVEGEYPPDAVMTLKIIDLKEGTQQLETLDEQNRTFELHKGREYLACLKDCPPGFIPEEEFLITRAQSTADIETTFVLHALDVRVRQYETDPETFIAGGVLALKDESDEEIFTFVPDEEGRVLDEQGNPFLFEAGTSYVLEQKENAPGYERGCEQLILIPEFMEESDEPLRVEYELEKLSSESAETEPAPQPFYEITRIARPLYGETDPFLNEEAEEESAEEAVHEVTAMAAYIPQTSVRIPEVYLNQPEQKESAKIENRIERAGFAVRLVNEEGKYISGASIAVLDERGRTVEQWQSSYEDHVVEGNGIKADATYTVHLVKPAEGFAGSVIDIEHTVKAKPFDSLPVIELCDTRVQKQTEEIRTETAKKTVNYALYACIGAALCICGAAAAVCLGAKLK